MSHRPSRAVAVMDEPQSIPVSIGKDCKTLELIAQNWDTSFILMTATQPGIKGIELVKETVYFLGALSITGSILPYQYDRRYFLMIKVGKRKIP